MSRRKRWQNVKGTKSRVTEPRERLIVAAASVAARVVSPLLSRSAAPTLVPSDVLVMRLDRIGDVLMTLPALHALRAALPDARIRLAVGEWSREIAKDAPVDEILVWSAPWVGRRDEGAATLRELFTAARSLDSHPPDLAIDLQGDLRALWLMAATGARARVGYANTGSSALLTAIVPLDENVSCVEQNYRAVEEALGRPLSRSPFRWLNDERRRLGRERLDAAFADAGVQRKGSVIGIHPGAGRAIKEWPPARFAELARRLVDEAGATLVLTGSAGERERTGVIHAAVPGQAINLAGRLRLDSFAEVMSACDAFVSCDTAAMHFACALGVPSVAIFGPSDPGRYFSGGADGFGSSSTHIALSPKLWCSPCNLIRRPPGECAAAPVPDCLNLLTTQEVFEATRRLLSAPG